MDDIRETVTIILTNKCNLNCVYCYECHKADREISFEDVKRIIDTHLMKDSKIGVNLELFGGEPFLAFPLMKQVVAYLEAGNWKRDYIIFADTNGTLFTDEVKTWLRAHPQVKFGLSLDGTPEMHNINRSNSFDQIDIEFFKEMNPDGRVKMTVSKASLPTLSDGIRYLHERGLHMSANLAYGEPWDETDIPILERELRKLADFYLEHPEYEPCSIIDFKLEAMVEHPAQQTVQIQYCGAGNFMTTYDVDGKAYPCQFFTPLTMGDRAVTSDQLNHSIKKQYPSYRIEPKCACCTARNLCPSCIGSNYHASGSIFKKDMGMCSLQKIQFKAAAYLKYHLWKRHRLSLSAQDEYALLNGITLAQAL